MVMRISFPDPHGAVSNDLITDISPAKIRCRQTCGLTDGLFTVEKLRYHYGAHFEKPARSCQIL